jgi:hypothetical protein
MKEAMTVESLIATLDVEEKARSKDVLRFGLWIVVPLMPTWLKANLVGKTKTSRTRNQRPNRTLILRRRKTLQT